MSAAADRTIPATPRRRRLAERAGMIPTATLPAWAATVTTTVLLLPAWWTATVAAASEALRRALATPLEGGAWPVVGMALPTVALVLVAATVGIGVRLLLDGFRIDAARVLPDRRRISPFLGLPRVLAPATFGRALAGALFLALPALVAARGAGGLLADVWAPLAGGTPAPPTEAAGVAVPTALAALLPVVATSALAAVVRHALRRRSAERRLRMTPEEWREELRDLAAPAAVKWARPPAPRPAAGQPVGGTA